MVHHLIQKGADINLANDANLTLLHFAAREGNKVLCEYLLDNGLDINAANDNGKTALHVAAEKNHTDLVKMLLMRGADKELRNAWNKTAAESSGGKFVFNLITNHEPGMVYQNLEDISDDDEKDK